MDFALRSPTPEPLVGFAYISVAVAPFADRDIQDLLLAARRTNAHYSVTGWLLVLEGIASGRVAKFFQWVEGSEPAVQVVQERIERDPRHQIVETLYRGPIDARRYAGWDMAIGRTDDERLYIEAVANVPIR